MRTGDAYRSICPNGLDMLLTQLDMHLVLDMLLRSVRFAPGGEPIKWLFICINFAYTKSEFGARPHRLVLLLNGFVFVVKFVIRTGVVFLGQIIKTFVLVEIDYAHIVAYFLVIIVMLTAFAIN